MPAAQGFVDDQVGSGRYSSVSEHIRGLIRDDEKRKAQATLEARLVVGIQSGESTGRTGQDWREIHQEARKQTEARKAKNRA